MNGRTCQLCGKALSRFSVGSGGDFCSREHRNQFRLRLGMDRLMEANKVANLMRRRENAKAIPAAQLARDSKVSPRVAPLVRMPVRQPSAHPVRPLAAALESPAIASRSQTLRFPPRTAAAMHSQVRPIDGPAFYSRPKRLLLPLRKDGLHAHILAAGAVEPRVTSAGVAQLRRQVTELRLNLRRTHIGGSGIQVRALNLPAQNCQEPQPARRLTNHADRGCELRVSGGIGFRLPSPRVRSIEFARPHTNAPVRATAPRGLTTASREMKSTTLSAGVIRFALRGPSGPIPPHHSNGVGFQWPNTLLDGPGPPRESPSGTRTCDVRWITPAPCPPQVRHTNGVVRLRSLTPPVPALSKPAARGITSEYRLTLVAFQPQETIFECPTALHGTLLSGAHFGSAPVRKAEAPLPTLEEHFDAGLSNWTGGTDDWKVDVAGVRPGSLALYSPSLELSNYQVEFLTRTDLHGITWVFRATGFHDYYKATLAVAQGGGYEFRRCAVIGDLAEGATVRHAPPAPGGTSSKTAVTVRMRLAGNEFTVSIDGQVVETWTDARLTAGGVGFVGAPEERARLYWVKVTPIGHTSKEYSKR
jgi:hypothetical protein